MLFLFVTATPWGFTLSMKDCCLEFEKGFHLLLWVARVKDEEGTEGMWLDHS